MISSWSHSRLAVFESCRYRAELMYVQKLQEPERPLPAGKSEHANDRGTRIHDGCERYVKGEIDAMPVEARKHFAPEMERMRELYSEGIVSLEGEWGMNRNWEPWDWRGQWVQLPGIPADEPFEKVKELPKRPVAGMVFVVGTKAFVYIPAWLRLKLDALVRPSPHYAIVIDYKSGKKWGNELKHGEQMQLYQLVTFLRYPEIEEIDVELWYLDVDEFTQKRFTRDQGLRFLKSWDKRGNAITTATSFPPNPSTWTCKWCFYGERSGGLGVCKSGKF